MMAKERKKEDTCGNAGGTSLSRMRLRNLCSAALQARKGFKMAPVRPSEEELGRKWDRCLVDTTFKAVGGAVFGGVFSLLFFKRSAWPITLGLGVGLGAGYSNCRHQFFWHGPHRPPFGRPPWGGGRPLWSRFGKDGESKHQDRKHSKPEGSPAVNQAESEAEPKQENKPSDS